jgi:AmiR/NasT family two-component response regulator
VKCFSNIFSALIAVGKKNPEVIIIDSHQLEEMMPDITNNINNEKDIDKIHMFVLTKNIKHKESYQNSGVCAVIGKPFTINDFNNLINSI